MIKNTAGGRGRGGGVGGKRKAGARAGLAMHLRPQKLRPSHSQLRPGQLEGEVSVQGIPRVAELLSDNFADALLQPCTLWWRQWRDHDLENTIWANGK